MKLEVMVRKLDTDKVIFHKTYTSKKKVAGNGADKVAASQALNLHDIMSRFAGDLERAVTQDK